MNKRICIVIDFVEIIPFFYNFAKTLELLGIEVDFIATTMREHELLRKNKVRLFPESLFSHFCRTHENSKVLSEAELDEAIEFSGLKAKADKEVLRNRAQRVAKYFQAYLRTRKPGTIVVWNGSFLSPKIMSILAKKEGIPVIYGENGYFSNTLQFDLSGVNSNSSICQMSLQELAVRLDNSPESFKDDSQDLDFKIITIATLGFRDRLKYFLLRQFWPGYAAYFPEVYSLESGLRKKRIDAFRQRIAVDKIDLPKNFIFLPLQVHDDTQILLNSQHFRNMEDFIEFSYAQMKKVFGNRFTLVVKEHPEDQGRISYDHIQARHPDIIWIKKYDLNELLEKASLVFVINSSVGLQAIQKYKPTVTFGESFYAKEGVVYRVDDLSRASEIIEKAATTPVNKENVDTLLRFLNERFFIKGSWKNFDGPQIVNAAQYILAMTK